MLLPVLKADVEMVENVPVLAWRGASLSYLHNCWRTGPSMPAIFNGWLAKRNEKAMEVFRFSREQHPDEKFVTHVGLARGYTALGDK